MRSSTFCCAQCRLLQPPTTSCADCGVAMVAPVELVRELLAYRDMGMGQKDWAFVAALVAGSSIAFPILTLPALGGLVAVGVGKLRALRRRKAIAPITIPPVEVDERATTLVGRPRRLRATLPSLAGDEPVLIEHAIIKDRTGGVLLRRAESVPFLLEVDDQPPVLVTGAARLAAAGLFSLRAPVKRGDARLARMGVPDDFAVAGELQVVSIADDGPLVCVSGVVEEEVLAEAAFHRDGGRMSVMRGRAGAPVIIEELNALSATAALWLG